MTTLTALHCPACNHHIADLALAAPRNGALRQDDSRPSQIAEQVSRFLRDRVSTGGRTPSSDFIDAYRLWCDAQGEEPASPQALGVALKALGVPIARSNGRRYYLATLILSTPF